MKRAQAIHRFIPFIGGIAVSLALAVLPWRSAAQEQLVKPPERIGVYDSRAVAVAYVGSTYQQQKMQELKAQSAKARAAGDALAVARLEREGQAWQKQLNQQGFGTGAVDDLLVHIQHELPKIQEAAGVQRLVSKWDHAELRKYGPDRQIDVTMPLVDAFHPTPAQRKRAIEIQKLKPVRVKEETNQQAVGR